MGENISVDLSLFVLLYKKNFMNKLKFDDLKKIKNNTYIIDCTNFLYFHSEERFFYSVFVPTEYLLKK